MATAYLRVSTWWGEVEAYKTDEQVYSPDQRKPMGANANAPGIGARRAMLVWTRDPSTAPQEDVMVSHFDFVNVTDGEPDDTWVDQDFLNIEANLSIWATALVGLWHSTTILDQVRWYKIGPGIAKPNPPVRITEVNHVGGGAGTRLPPQCALTITDRTGVRLEWGRKYLPFESSANLEVGTGRASATIVDLIATSTDSFYRNVAALDYLPVVYGKARQKTYSIESVQVDDVVDIQRRRRWDSPIYKRRIPAGG